MSRRPVLFVVVAAVGAALVTGLAAAPGAGAAAPAAKRPSDAAIARQALLRLSDFPAGWKQSKHKASKPSGIRSCKATESATARSKKYGAESPDFSENSTTLAQNAAFVFPKESQAIGYLKAFQATEAGTCLQQRSDKALKKVTGATAQVQQLDLSSALQSGSIDDAVGYGVGITVPAQAQPAQLALIFVATRLGRSVAVFSTENENAVLPLTNDLINASLARLKQALG